MRKAKRSERHGCSGNTDFVLPEKRQVKGTHAANAQSRERSQEGRSHWAHQGLQTTSRFHRLRKLHVQVPHVYDGIPEERHAGKQEELTSLPSCCFTWICTMLWAITVFGSGQSLVKATPGNEDWGSPRVDTTHYQTQPRLLLPVLWEGEWALPRCTTHNPILYCRSLRLFLVDRSIKVPAKGKRISWRTTQEQSCLPVYGNWDRLGPENQIQCLVLTPNSQGR